MVVGDVYEGALNKAKEMGIQVVPQDNIYEEECDIFSPCALGGVLNPDTIPRLRCQVVAGAANNQLNTDEDGLELHRRGILYAPDYIINAGGIINASAEYESTYNSERAREKTERIYDILAKVFARSKSEEDPTACAADRLAEERLSSVRKVKRIYRPN